jgi:hypothetical protein
VSFYILPGRVFFCASDLGNDARKGRQRENNYHPVLNNNYSCSLDTIQKSGRKREKDGGVKKKNLLEKRCEEKKKKKSPNRINPLPLLHPPWQYFNYLTNKKRSS